jgi:hypothetical protein
MSGSEHRRRKVQLTGGMAIVLRGEWEVERWAVDELDGYDLTGRATHRSDTWDLVSFTSARVALHLLSALDI